jgi:hypothetical protein
MLVIKADGTEEEFKPEKLASSLRRAGADPREVADIVQAVEQKIKPRATTQMIYREAFEMLRESARPVAAKYSLRRAVFGLGPTGFPFEDFIARVFAAEGYSTKTRLTIQGRCALHEIDVAGYRKDHSFIAEAKFHAQPGTKSDLQVALYSYARYLDLKAHPICEEDTCGIVSFIIVTNTKFTRAAIDYATCAGVELLSWGYPFDNSLQERVDRLGVYPITVLNTLSQVEKATLLQAGVILCSEILQNPEVLSQNNVSKNKVSAVLEESRQLCHKK